MGTLYIDRKDILIRDDGNTLAFYANGTKEGSVPIKPLKRVVIVGSVTLETSALHKLAQEGVTVVFLSGRSLSFNGIFHGRLHNNGVLRVKQYEMSLSDFSRLFSVEIVRRKVDTQIGLLKEALQERPDKRLPLFTALKTLEKISEKVTGLPDQDTLMGLEGGAASSYFQAYTTLFADSLGFVKRTRRPPEDPVNAMLSLCYTMLHYEMVREIEVIGLDPFIGFYHRFEYGRESLACDLVESFRADVDRFVWHLFRKREFTDRDFFQDSERAGCYLKKEGRKRFYPMHEQWAKEMRGSYVNSVRELTRRIMDGQDALSE
ncbi:MAG: CRISPR-associated endonuclease Cas1 [Candidatus Magnetobacterium sp. LHC-1]|uniref:CRISPR-associated endonuclease Cas1 n=1 Tax=Candidatus Magnetobacterium casense TaxID=1455061 RepID=A0ABS6S0S5_9BACT|nr:CRISPR-associated endonuclease Cas1 [Candidatus Magnetobacterium casensis]MBV6341994.1 CRISPR-associated endonuclease Cas1 [Candidatus Magnetobacterium casensis]